MKLHNLQLALYYRPEGVIRKVEEEEEEEEEELCITKYKTSLHATSNPPW
jgi:hypothetical protein